MWAAMVIPILHSPRATKGCHTFLHGEAILLAPPFPHSPLSILRGGVTTPSVWFLREKSNPSCFVIFSYLGSVL